MVSEVIELPVAVRRGDRWTRVGTAMAHHGNMPRVGDHVLIDTIALVIEVVMWRADSPLPVLLVDAGMWDGAREEVGGE